MTLSGHEVVTRYGEEEVRAFVPMPLPLDTPPFVVPPDIERDLRVAEIELGKLAVAAGMVPDASWFIYGFVRKEAVVSSQIEGVQASLMDVLNAEASETKQIPDDVGEICNYIDALTYGRAQIASAGGIPLSLRLLREMHARLMHGARGQEKSPGEFRRTQNWIGGSRPGNAVYVPPPPEQMAECLVSFEAYLHAQSPVHPLIRAGMAHVQFETIHPFLDGNGRLGRLLITVLLEHWRVLPSPLLYLSLHFKRTRSDYYDGLMAVRRKSDWERWIRYFVGGVSTMARETTETATRLHKAVTLDRRRLQLLPGVTIAAIQLFELLLEHPIVTVPAAAKMLKTTAPTARRAVAALVEADIVRERTHRARDREYAYANYLEILCRETEVSS